MRISEPTRQRVLRAAQELDYRPNLTARSLRTQKSRTIGLVADTIATGQYGGEMIRGSLMAALRHQPSPARLRDRRASGRSRAR